MKKPTHPMPPKFLRASHLRGSLSVHTILEHVITNAVENDGRTLVWHTAKEKKKIFQRHIHGCNYQNKGRAKSVRKEKIRS